MLTKKRIQKLLGWGGTAPLRRRVAGAASILRTIRLSVLLALAAILSIGCTARAPLKAVPSSEVQRPFLVARYQPDYYSQTPEWTLRLGEDGRAEIEVRTRKKDGWYRLPGLSADQVGRLKARIAKVGFFELPPDVVALEDHVPEQVVQVYLDDREHRVRVRGACLLQDQPDVHSFLSIWTMLVDLFPSLERYESEYFDILCREVG